MNTLQIKPLRPVLFRERGSALITTMFLMFVIGLAAAGVLTIIKQDMHMGGTLKSRVAAREVANGAMEQALAWLAKNPHQEGVMSTTASAANVRAGTLGAGSYTVTAATRANGTIVLLSTGSATGQVRTTRVYLHWIDSNIAFDNAIFSDASIAGNGTFVITGRVYSNASVNLGGSSSVNGDVYSAAANPVATVTSGHTKTGNMPVISFPQLDTQWYLQTASTNGQVYNASSLHFPVTFNNPAGGVIVINGNVKLSGLKDILTVNGGTLVINNGDLTSTGNGKVSITPVTNTDGTTPSLMVLNGSISLGGNSNTLKGLIYTNAGSVSLQGTSDVYANVVSKGTVTPGGTANLVSVTKNNIKIDPNMLKPQIFAWEEN